MNAPCIAAAALALAPLSAAALDGANPVSIEYDEALYQANDTITLTVSAEPGTSVLVGFDLNPGPTFIPGVGNVALELGAGFFAWMLPPMPASGSFELVDNKFGCTRFQAFNTLYTQAVSIDPFTPRFSLSNLAVLQVEDPNGVCSDPGAPSGCTPGYWKNHASQWADTPYAPGDDFDTTFGVDAIDPDDTLIDILAPGSLRAFGAHYVAALLNASHSGTNYPLAPAEVLALVQSTLSTGTEADKEALKDMFETYNELGCPF